MSDRAHTLDRPYPRALRALDDPWPRMAWVFPAAVAIWIALLAMFALVLARSQRALPPPPPPVDASLIELPPSGGGGGGAPAPPRPAPAPPEVPPPVAKPVVHPPPRVVPEAIPRHVAHPPRHVRPAPVVASVPTGVTGSISKPGPGGPGPSAPGKAGTGGLSLGGGVGEGNVGAEAVYAPIPEIPEELRGDVMHTVAIARFRVYADGRTEAVLSQPTGSPRLNGVLLDALRQWRFMPAMRDGKPIASVFEIRIPVDVE